ncbi:MAG: hypothetical protein MRY83_05035, partial [Flavobacteriales bacterium]|nr:hypothetical protein [Flavobacteriales bacterium]
EMYRNSSPYNYVLNNPLKYSDPTGMMANPVNGNEKSNEKRHSSDGLNKAVDVLQEKLSRSEKASRVIESIDKNISEMSLRELERVYEAKSDALDDVVVKMDVLGSFGKFGSLETLTKSGVEVSSDFYRSDGTRYTDLEIVSMVKDLTFSLAVLADQIPHVKLARISLSTGLFAQHVRLSFELNKLERRILKIDPDFFDTRSSFGGAGAGTNDWNK